MLFFKVEAKRVGRVSKEEGGEPVDLDLKSRALNGKCDNMYYFVSNIEDDKIEGCMLVMNENEKDKKDVSFPWGKLNFEVENEIVSEITSADFSDELDKTESHACLRSPAIKSMLRGMRHSIIFDKGGIFADEPFYSEVMVEPESKEEYIKFAEKNLWCEELSEEFERIYSPLGSRKFMGHPVHYLLRSDNFEVREETAKKLVGALWQNGRLESRRLGTLSVSNIGCRDLRYLKGLYSCYTGGTICLRFRNLRLGDDYASSVEETAETICGLIKEYKNKVLTIFCFPLSAENEKALFFDKLNSISVCEFSDSVVNAERATEYIKSFAAETGVQPDDALIAKIVDGKSYLSTDLKIIFDDWYDDMLKRTAYPAYSNVKPLGTKKTEKKIEGLAYEKLMSMIGLDSVKTIIRQAVNYYKASKIFSDKGMTSKRLAMNMVFAGSPGTAKTTVARLFAEIMKSNKVLSSGHLVEVGRSELVSRYVGNTAPLIKRQFALAKGGVLFIDEAYSLLDDRAGSFGDEAINTIVQEMENNREDTAVIFAGYTDKMKEFIERNPGLNSRIAFFVNFDNYSVDELMQITRNMSADYGVNFTAEALDKLKEIYRENYRSKDFGNGRFVRNMIEKAKFAQTDRLMSRGYENVTEDDISTITAEDIIIRHTVEKNKFSLGFGE